MSKKKNPAKKHKQRQTQGVSKPVPKTRRPQSSRQQSNKNAQKQFQTLASTYNESQHILCVGEGNFSFARALARLLCAQGQNVVATAFDSQETLLAKYEEGSEPVSEIIQELHDCSAAVCYKVDATKLAKSLQAASKRQHMASLPASFDRIIFNFPHIGLGIKDQDVNVRKNQQMLAAFFVSSCEVLKPDGEVHVTLKEGKPYSLWNLVSLAHHATQGVLTLKTTRAFDPEQFPGYSHRRTLGFKEGESSHDNEEIRGSNKTYVFRLKL